MRANIQSYILFRQLAAYFLLSRNFEVAARPAPQDAPATTTDPAAPTPVTLVATGTDGNVITEVYTPTTIAISGLTPPITQATTITQVITSDGVAETVAIAVAAGAGIVGAGALAAWLFKPVPGAPPAPTTPPSYPTSTQEQPPDTTTEDPETTTEEQPAACPFTQVNPERDFKGYSIDPTWTGPIPTLTSSAVVPSCTPQGSNKQLLRGTDPGYITGLSDVFCKSDLSRDQGKTLGVGDLPDGNSFKDSEGLKDVRVKFDFKFGSKHDSCPKNCVDAYTRMIKSCQYNSHSLYGGASSAQGCGTYSFMIDAEPLTKKECNPVDSRGRYFNYMYRDAAILKIEDFCTSVDGKEIKQGDAGTNQKADPFSISYADECRGSGTYKITKEYCTKYFTQTVDDCDTDTRMFKHGGTLTDTDNCGQFKFTPTGYDVPDCYPSNKDHGYITSGEHVSLKHDVAMDAITQFCDRSGDGQQYTLDPDKIPSGDSFVQDTCKAEGYAQCGYFYKDDGSRVTDAGNLGDFVIRASASYYEPEGFPCQAKQKYEIHGDRCKAELTKVVDEWCNTNVQDGKDLGSFLESGELGCVRWDMWAVRTH